MTIIAEPPVKVKSQEQLSSFCPTWDLFTVDGAVAEVRAFLKNDKAKEDLKIEDGVEIKQESNAISGYFDNSEAFCKALDTLEREGETEAIYVTLNPVKKELAKRAYNRLIRKANKTTSDADIVRRCWLLIDFDPNRASHT